MQGKVGAKAIERAMLDMFKNLKYVELYGRTIPHIVQAENTKVGDVYPANRAVVGDITLFCVPHVAMVDPVHLSQTEVVLRPAKTSRGIKAHRAIAAICQVCASFFLLLLFSRPVSCVSGLAEGVWDVFPNESFVVLPCICICLLVIKPRAGMSDCAWVLLLFPHDRLSLSWATIS